MGEGMDSLMQPGLQCLAGLRPGIRRRRTVRPPLGRERSRVGCWRCSVGAAFPPVIGANSAHLVSMWKALEDTPVPVRHDLEQLGSVAADIGRSVEGRDGAAAGVSLAGIRL